MSVSLQRPPRQIAVDVAQPADQTFTLIYEGLAHIQGPWCTVDVYRREGLTIIVATDETDTHGDCSITNRIERVMYLAWERAEKPWPVAFVEHYRHGIRQSEHFDLVEFTGDGHRLREGVCWSATKSVGPEFQRPNWTALQRVDPDTKGFVLPAHYGRQGR